MTERTRGGVAVAHCESCGGIFLERAELGRLIEAENDWHRASGPRTQPLPKITADMAAPPPDTKSAGSRSFVDELFS
jgi:uncharacterized protein